VATNSKEPTYHILERDDGSWAMYYTMPGNPTQYIVMDSLDENYCYLDVLTWWKHNDSYAHGFAIKTNGKILVIIRFLKHNAWLYALCLPDAGETRPYSLLVSTTDGASGFMVNYLDHYKFVVECLGEIAAMTDYPVQLPAAGYSVVKPYMLKI